MKHKRAGRLCMLAGALCILLGAGLTGYNLYTDQAAEEHAEQVLAQLRTSCSLPALEEQVSGVTEPAEPMEIYPAQEEASLVIDGERYIGVLQIPALGVELPVRQELSKQGLKKTPCRYKGSAENRDLLIAAHNYSRHFGRIGQLVSDDIIRFIDLSGRVYIYQVDQTQIIDGYDMEEMFAGQWDMTLFTCTLGGKSRVTVRCSLLCRVTPWGDTV